MDIRTWLTVAVTPAMSLLPPKMDTPAARTMMVAIALQESRLTHRRQIRGPARGFMQFETGGVRGVLRHHASKDHAIAALQALDYRVDVDVVHAALEHNDCLAAVFGRLLLYTLPQPLPVDADAGWAQYVDAWRPGKPHRHTWNELYEQAAIAV